MRIAHLRRVAWPGAGALAAAAAMVAPGGAAGAYAPTLAVELGSAEPGVAPSLTSTMTQSSGESATRTARIRYSPEFGFNPAFAVVGCTPAQEQAGACPEASQIGAARAQTPLGTFAGEVHFTTDFRLVIFLRDATGLIQQKVVGTFRVLEDGSREVVLDNLPNAPSTFSQVALEGGSKGILLNPRNCGTYSVTAHFESHAGEVATSEPSVEIAGCRTGPRITAVRVRPPRFRPTDGSSGKGNGGATVSWQLSEGADRTDIALQRRTPESWRQFKTLRGSGDAGRNELRLTGRLRGRALPPDSYRVVLRAIGPDGAISPSRANRFRILPPRG
jgi:hypothetical protein